jgi:hypothetical protein
MKTRTLNAWFAGCSCVALSVAGWGCAMEVMDEQEPFGEAPAPYVDDQCVAEATEELVARPLKGKNVVPGNAKDVRGKMRALEPEEGLNLIDRSGELGLYARYVDDKFQAFEVLDAQGNRVPTQLTRGVNAAGETTCWRCGTDAGGATHCWVIPCPVITGPWLPGGSATRQ